MTTYNPYKAVGTVADRELGLAPGGEVGLRNFDQGVVTTLGATLYGSDTGRGHLSNYYISSGILPVEPPPGVPGVPVTFSHPEDIWERYRVPVIVVRRDEFVPAMSRWHPGMVVWRGPAPGAKEARVVYDEGTRGEVVLLGYDRYMQQEMAVPFDITYTVSIYARNRGKGPIPPKGTPTGFTGAEGSPRNQVNRMTDYVLRRLPPYGQITVIDSVGDTRGYYSFMEGLASLDEVEGVRERVLGFAITVRVEAELNLSDPIVCSAVTSALTQDAQLR